MVMGGRGQGGETTNVNGEGGGERTAAAEGAVGRVPLHRLFAFADRTDVALMAVGAAAAVANGLAQPLMTFIFGDVIDAFGSASSPDVLRKVTKVRACLSTGYTETYVRPYFCVTRRETWPEMEFGSHWQNLAHRVISNQSRKARSDFTRSPHDLLTSAGPWLAGATTASRQISPLMNCGIPKQYLLLLL